MKSFIGKGTAQRILTRGEALGLIVCAIETPRSFAYVLREARLEGAESDKLLVLTVALLWQRSQWSLAATFGEEGGEPQPLGEGRTAVRRLARITSRLIK